MTDEPGLIAAIIQNPDDDTPRLIYCDWLRENGRERRADMIRRMIVAAKQSGGGSATILAHGGWSPSRGGGFSCKVNPHWGRGIQFPKLGVQCRALYEPARAFPQVGIHRGFIHEVFTDWSVWMAHARDGATYWHENQERACPVTAQPIDSVVLLSSPLYGRMFRGLSSDNPVMVLDGDRHEDGVPEHVLAQATRDSPPESDPKVPPPILAALLRHRFPRIKFTINLASARSSDYVRRHER